MIDYEDTTNVELIASGKDNLLILDGTSYLDDFNDMPVYENRNSLQNLFEYLASIFKFKK